MVAAGTEHNILDPPKGQCFGIIPPPILKPLPEQLQSRPIPKAVPGGHGYIINVDDIDLPKSRPHNVLGPPLFFDPPFEYTQSILDGDLAAEATQGLYVLLFADVVEEVLD